MTSRIRGIQGAVITALVLVSATPQASDCSSTPGSAGGDFISSVNQAFERAGLPRHELFGFSATPDGEAQEAMHAAMKLVSGLLNRLIETYERNTDPKLSWNDVVKKALAETSAQAAKARQESFSKYEVAASLLDRYPETAKSLATAYLNGHYTLASMLKDRLKEKGYSADLVKSSPDATVKLFSVKWTRANAGQGGEFDEFDFSFTATDPMGTNLTGGYHVTQTAGPNGAVYPRLGNVVESPK